MDPIASSTSPTRVPCLPFHDDTLAPISTSRITLNIPSLRNHRVLRDFTQIPSRHLEEDINRLRPIPSSQNMIDYEQDIFIEASALPIGQEVINMNQIPTIQRPIAIHQIPTVQEIPDIRPESPIFAFNPPPIQPVHKSTFNFKPQVIKPIHPKPTLNLPVLKVDDPIFYFNPPVYQPIQVYRNSNGFLVHQEVEKDHREAGVRNAQLLDNKVDTESQTASSQSNGSGYDSRSRYDGDVNDQDSVKDLMSTPVCATQIHGNGPLWHFTLHPTKHHQEEANLLRYAQVSQSLMINHEWFPMQASVSPVIYKVPAVSHWKHVERDEQRDFSGFAGDEYDTDHQISNPHLNHSGVSCNFHSVLNCRGLAGDGQGDGFGISEN
ncbi:hypothetical protein DFH28DRAFT_1106303 [Melampsora americana]|nr:hypothetical protein DFH28DRAFT_1106303 [Melampsora americana]